MHFNLSSRLTYLLAGWLASLIGRLLNSGETHFLPGWSARRWDSQSTRVASYGDDDFISARNKCVLSFGGKTAGKLAWWAQCCRRLDLAGSFQNW